MTTNRTTTALAALLCAALLPLSASGPSNDSRSGDAGKASAALARFAALEGTWRGKSTKGWTEEVTFRSVAGGSAILETSIQDGGQNPMATVFHLDGGRLLLTHYCMAKNHPRLVASAFEDGAVTFTFLDGTNLPSRDRGHMDKAVYRFEDADHYTTRWTWYQDGKERWMEEIRMERVSTADSR